MVKPFEHADRIAVGFAMDYSGGLTTGMHYHPRAQLIYAITGVMKIETEDAFFVVPPTNALLLPENVSHSITMEGDVAMRELFLHQDVAKSLGQQIRVMTVGALFRELMVAICKEPVDWNVSGRAQHIVALIIDEINRAQSLPTQLPLPKDARVLSVAREIIQKPYDVRSLEDWAEICGASSRTVARLFLSETGMSFGQWRLQARLNAGFVLLMIDGNIPRIAEAVGFSSQSAFGVAFRRTFGLTPGQARNLHVRPGRLSS
ncbi:AraC family transcriptional regulator [Rhizobium sp. 9140]|uniref:AraC family transcriptional regulator n=1 Tax=Rhizobium sp. 9140 TaxID=1761900 RepID=UPI0015868D41|nr:helix-turn-helix transcriptional regulator [Rhizobium sp. 9140]